jgi:gas vesicle protein
MAAGRFIKFASGGLFGAGVGTALAILFAPESGDRLRTRVHGRLKEARLAGLEAQAETESAMIARYRAKVGDTEALRDYERERTDQRTESVGRLAADTVADALPGSARVD